VADAFDEKAVFLAALSLPPGDRAAFLDGACPDPESRRRLGELLAKADDPIFRTGAGALGGLGPSGGGAEANVRDGGVGAQVGADQPDQTRTGGGQVARDAQGDVTQIDEFRIVRVLGEGGMGRVYLAEDLELGRKVAIKVLAPHLLGSEQAIARFKVEARSTAALKHPGIVPVHRFMQAAGLHYIVSEFVDGPTLKQVIAEEVEFRRGGVQTRMLREWFARCARIVAAVAEALECSHRANIVHRDVKPSNILIDAAAGPRLTDFGIAKQMTEEARTDPSDLIGSCHYMSPEQASIANARVDRRSDVFSLGVVLYEMLALKRPFDGDDVPRVLSAVVSHDPPALRSVDRSVPRDLETICAKAMEKKPALRYQTAAHMAADLRCFLEGEPILASPPSLARRAARWGVMHRRTAVAAVGLGLLSTAGLSGWALRSERRAAKAWLDVDSGGVAASVRVRRLDRASGLLEPLDGFTGALGPGVLRLPPGQYRITVVRDVDGAACDFNVIASATGRERLKVLRVVERPADLRYGPELRSTTRADIPATLDAAGRTLLGVLTQRPKSPPPGMIHVEAGDYKLGPENIPVAVREFFIDARKVTNREYREFIEATGYRVPNFWEIPNTPPMPDGLPVVGVTVEEAEAYARWRGKRLPTVLEWQAAARGKDGRRFPWGDQPRPSAPPASLAHARTAQSDDAVELLNAYCSMCVPADVDLDGAAPGEDRMVQTLGNTREICADIDVAQQVSLLVGRSATDLDEKWSLAHVATQPINFPHPFHGFRCAVSAPERF